MIILTQSLHNPFTPPPAVSLYCLLASAMDTSALLTNLVLGLPAEDHFLQPFASQSPAEFWGVRWNMTVGKLLREFMYNPLVQRGRWGGKKVPLNMRRLVGGLACFGASGVMHQWCFWYVRSGVVVLVGWVCGALEFSHEVIPSDPHMLSLFLSLSLSHTHTHTNPQASDWRCMGLALACLLPLTSPRHPCTSMAHHHPTQATKSCCKIHPHLCTYASIGWVVFHRARHSVWGYPQVAACCAATTWARSGCVILLYMRCVC